MPHNWILDVLDDMRSYCRLNGLGRLAHDLDHLVQTARSEIALAQSETGGAAPAEEAADLPASLRPGNLIR